MKRVFWTVAAVALLLFISDGTRADLIVNGGFESGSLAPGWTGGNSVQPSGTFGVPSNSGSYYLALGGVGNDADTSQTVTDVPGQQYDLQFFYYSDGATPNDLHVYFDPGSSFTGTNLVYSEVNSGPHGYVEHDIIVTGTGTDTITFGARNDPAFDGLDDVSLDSISSAVPEPSGAIIVFIGLAVGTFGAWRLRHKSVRANVVPESASTGLN